MKESKEQYRKRRDVGVSRRALSLARRIDRLPYGSTHMIVIAKEPGKPWKADIRKLQPVAIVDLPEE